MYLLSKFALTIGFCVSKCLGLAISGADALLEHLNTDPVMAMHSFTIYMGRIYHATLIFK